MNKTEIRIRPFNDYEDNAHLIQRFESKIYFSIDNCWYWTGSLSNKGYGYFSYKNQAHVASRVSYKIYRGNPGKSMVCHSCDNPACVNPDHLFLGTIQDNVDDMFKKGRGRKVMGTDHPDAKLTEDQVKYIRSMRGKVSQKSLADKFGIIQPHVSRIQLKTSWKSI